MEALLHYVWKYKLYESGDYLTSDRIPFEIIDPGIYNPNAGPDFFNAKIKFGDKVWAGNVEIHTASSDWYKHRHEKDKAYNSVILHVVERIDAVEIRDESHRLIPQWRMKIPRLIEDNYRFLLGNDSSVPCLEKIHEIPKIYLSDWKNALLTERLERKTKALLQLLADYQDDWNEVFYITLARNFGFGINNDAFERLAKSLSLKIILKHQHSEIQTEALFLGQAGLLEEEGIEDAYYRNLQEEYFFLRKKYNLKTLDAHIFKSLRIRPNNFPHIKIVQLAGIIRKKQGLFSEILDSTDWEKFKPLLTSETGEYWLTHYNFDKTAAKRRKQLGLSAIQLLVINVVVPLLFAYGKKKNAAQYTEKALRLLEAIPAERNHIISSFSLSGIEILNACDTQALIQLKREYCEQKKCIYCRIGHKLLIK
ncbi:MAG: DUF2851 family protein [Dysgonamonadaceae bacterium]|jgi:hypothetical protein|nr:DUF2851 family protein [Dysgonamonadaceae bacterium]